jgi:hypothetical protein
MEVFRELTAYDTVIFRGLAQRLQCNRSSLIRDICDKKRIRYEQEGKTLVLNACKYHYSTVKECYYDLQIINVEERVTNQEEGIYKTIRRKKEGKYTCLVRRISSSNSSNERFTLLIREYCLRKSIYCRKIDNNTWGLCVH